MHVKGVFFFSSIENVVPLLSNFLKQNEYTNEEKRNSEAKSNTLYLFHKLISEKSYRCTPVTVYLQLRFVQDKSMFNGQPQL